MNKKISLFFFFLGVLAMLFFAYVRPAKADSAELDWTEPTGSESCVADPSDPDPEFYRIYQLIGEVAHPVTNFNTGPLLPGDYTFIATTVQRNTGVESRVSGATTKTVGPMIAQAGTTVYQPVHIDTGFWMIPMGTVTVDTECDVTQRANDFYRVPGEAVTWTATDARPQLVVAACQ